MVKSNLKNFVTALALFFISVSFAQSTSSGVWEDVGGVKIRKNKTAHDKVAGFAWAGYSGYNSGGSSGGYSSEKKLTLCADGSMKLYSQSVVTVNISGGGGNSASEENDKGTWEVYEDQSGNLFLKMVLEKSGEGFVHFKFENGKMVFENGESLSKTTADCK